MVVKIKQLRRQHGQIYPELCSYSLGYSRKFLLSVLHRFPLIPLILKDGYLFLWYLTHNNIDAVRFRRRKTYLEETCGMKND